jgi:hypothetical protein
VRRTDARSRERNTPEGVAHSFQVSVYKVEPRADSRARNLLSKHRCRSALADEMEPGRPEMPLIVKPSSFTCRAERLARATASPDGAICRPSGKLQGISPSADAGEEMTLAITAEVSGLNVLDASLIHFPLRDQPALDQFSEPRGCLRVELVVVVHAVRSTALGSTSR